MAAPSRLKGTSNETHGRAQKSPSPAVSASLNLGTSLADVITYTGGVEVANGGAWLDIGNAPGVNVTVAFTHSTSETLTVTPILAEAVGGDVSADPTIGAPPAGFPAVSATGVNPGYPTSLTFTKTDWSTTLSPLSSATVKYISFYVKANGKRLVKFMSAANSAAGSVVFYVSAGTDGAA